MNRATLARRAMLAPNPWRLGEFGQRINLAAERARAAFASRRGGVGRKDYTGGGHSSMSLGQVDEPDRYRDRPPLASSEGKPMREAPIGNETQPTAKRAGGISFASFVNL